MFDPDSDSAFTQQGKEGPPPTMHSSSPSSCGRNIGKSRFRFSAAFASMTSFGMVSCMIPPSGEQ